MTTTYTQNIIIGSGNAVGQDNQATAEHGHQAGSWRKLATAYQDLAEARLTVITLLIEKNDKLVLSLARVESFLKKIYSGG